MLGGRVAISVTLWGVQQADEVAGCTPVAQPVDGAICRLHGGLLISRKVQHCSVHASPDRKERLG